jgi:hypothetical protein
MFYDSEKVTQNMSDSARRDFLKLAAVSVLASVMPRTAFSEDEGVCDNPKLMDALRILHRACSQLKGCDFSELRVLNDSRYRDVLLAALGTQALHPVHIFFPDNVTDIRRCYDWRSAKSSQLNAYQYYGNLRNTTIFLIGRASHTGSELHNRALSSDRMESVKTYLDSLKIPCRDVRGAWMGKEVLQFTPSDAVLLGIAPSDYRKSPLVLNQAVHVFAVPCPNLGL